MKFIQVFNRYLMRGGEETSVRRIRSHLELGGHQVIPFWRDSAEWVGPGAPARSRQPFLMWRNRKVLEELCELQEREHAEAWILHNVLPVISLGVYRLAGDLKVPVIQWLHNYRPLSPSGTLQAGGRLLRPDDPWIAWKETWAGSWRGRLLTGWVALAYAWIKWRGDFSSVRAWIAVSDGMKNIFERGGLPAARLYTLRHSWDMQGDAPPPDTDEGYFLFLGRMVETKGVRFLVDLWHHPALTNIPLVMAGEGPLYDQLRQSTPQSIRWVGYVEGEPKKRLMAGARAILFPSLWPEPLSTVAYEAYEMGKPIISSSAGGMKELVFDGKTGRLLEPGNISAWKEAILDFARNALLSREQGMNGWRWLKENVSPESWNRQFNDIVQQALRT